MRSEYNDVYECAIFNKKMNSSQSAPNTIPTNVCMYEFHCLQSFHQIWSLCSHCYWQICTRSTNRLLLLFKNEVISVTEMSFSWLYIILALLFLKRIKDYGKQTTHCETHNRFKKFYIFFYNYFINLTFF